MADIVGRLREKAVGKHNNVGDLWGDLICDEAADTIESLRDEVRRLQCGLSAVEDLASCDPTATVDDCAKMARSFRLSKSKMERSTLIHQALTKQEGDT